jgi:thioredoxin-related protein
MKRYLVYVLVSAFTLSVGAVGVLPSKTDTGEKSEKKSSSKEKPTRLTWHKYDEGVIKAKKEKKHIMVHFYTTWCGWCKRMDRNTFNDEEVKKVLNESYVPIRVNGQSGQKLKVDGKEISERQLTGQYGVRSYPITWFLKPSGERIAPRRGYAEPDEFLYILNWVKDDLYDKISFQEFVKQEREKEKSKKE